MAGPRSPFPLRYLDEAVGFLVPRSQVSFPVPCRRSTFRFFVPPFFVPCSQIYHIMINFIGNCPNYFTHALVVRDSNYGFRGFHTPSIFLRPALFVNCAQHRLCLSLWSIFCFYIYTFELENLGPLMYNVLFNIGGGVGREWNKIHRGRIWIRVVLSLNMEKT